MMGNCVDGRLIISLCGSELADKVITKKTSASGEKYGRVQRGCVSRPSKRNVLRARKTEILKNLDEKPMLLQ